MTLLHEMGMFLEVLVFVVFQDKHAAFAKQVALKNEVDQLVVVFAIVGRVGEDEVILHLMFVQEAENIGADDEQFFHVEFVSRLADESHAAEVLVDGHHFRTAS